MTQSYFLRGDVKAEPLVNGWYAWPQLLSPASFAMQTANSHMKIMKSFVLSPKVHIAALKDPTMRGGPFLDASEDQVPQIKDLLKKNQEELGHMVAFAKAVKELDAMLAKEADGGSLEPLYEKVPEPLKGFVELVYEVNHIPGFRFLEGLLYESDYFMPSLQSVSLGRVAGDRRPFMLSTPRTETLDDELFLKKPYDDPGFDALFKMRRTPQTLETIRQALNLDDDQLEQLKPLLTTEQPRLPEDRNYDGDGVRIRYFGHATVLIQTKNVSILTDPITSYEFPTDSERYTINDLPDHIDYVLITHTHQDHILMEFMLQLRHKIGTVVVPTPNVGALADPSLKLMLQYSGFKSVVSLDEMEKLPCADGYIQAIPFLGEHHDLNITSKSAYMVSLCGSKHMFAADSCNIESATYRHIEKAIGRIDTLFVGMECVGSPLSWSCGALLTRKLDRTKDYSRRGKGSDSKRGLELVDILKPKNTFVYAMGMEPWLSFILDLIYEEGDEQLKESEDFVAQSNQRGVPSERLFMRKELFFN